MKTSSGRKKHFTKFIVLGIMLTGLSSVLLFSPPAHKRPRSNEFHPLYFFGEEPTRGKPLSLLAVDRRQKLSSPRVILGNEKLFAPPRLAKLKGLRLGLVVNQTSRLPEGKPLWEVISHHDLNLTAIFTPEHGLQMEIEAGQPVRNSSWRDIPIYSLYGSHFRPSPEQLARVDVLIYDLQDIGTRFYTYITTLKYILEAAATQNKKVIICDRPNPLGGAKIEGPLLQPRFKSFIGALPLPIRYGLTPGELALMMKGEGWIPKDVELEVIPMEGWTRADLWPETGLEWIPTSPNIPGPENALLYPGFGLLGGLRINQGLGTEAPFLRVGAPWIAPELLIRELSSHPSSAGLRLQAITYIPRSIPGKILTPPFKDRICQGVQIKVEEPRLIEPVYFTLHLIRILKKYYPDKIKPTTTGLNRLFGSSLLSEYLKNRLSFNSLMKQLENDAREFRVKRRKYLLYQ
jgi:uncharacterized protein YbbC (DUF1343 family)